ncbi:hypothetical protein OBV_31290 [Oscillibacter valericigenes Sjm18-20]|nr:hypothetical protein OBV_15400 [Oscillibacter valericigenes Sjm18-20]BAL00328.1 hypothetical protein OBV_31290 [Oscillibacter valericigenes Sjm18-20]
MPDLDGKKSDSYQFLEQMSTEKLKSIARADFESGDSDDAANDKFITRVMEVIAQRDEEDPTAPHFDVEAGWKDFQENYCPTEEKTIDVYGDNKQNKLVHESSKNEEQADLKAPQPKRAGHRFLRIITIAAAVVCLCAVAANAFEINIFKMFAQWTQEIFQFHTEEISSQGAKYTSGTVLDSSQTLEDALKKAGITQPVSPKWIPEGFTFVTMDAYPNIGEPLYTALYENETTGHTIIVSVNVHKKPQASVQEKDDSQVSVYTAGEIDHYIMENNDVLTATWFADNLECSIMGEISESDMEAMINSIYEE